MQIEKDTAEVRGGVRGGETLGSPLVLWIAEPRLRQLGEGDGPRRRSIPTSPRRGASSRRGPGHTDLAGGIKYQRRDLRDILERASARETTARVAAGAFARMLLRRIRRRDQERRPLPGADRRRPPRSPPGTTSCGSTRPRRCAPSTATLEPEMVAARRAGQGGGGHARRRGDGDRPRRAGRARLARAVGREARRPPRPGDRSPSTPSRRWRSAPASPPRRGFGSAAHDAIERDGGRPLDAAPPTAPAASKGASPTARTW